MYKTIAFLIVLGHLLQVIQITEFRNFFSFFKVSTFSQAVSAKVEQAKDATGNIRIPGMLKKDKCYTLLVIDDPNTDW